MTEKQAMGALSVFLPQSTYTIMEKKRTKHVRHKSHLDTRSDHHSSAIDADSEKVNIVTIKQDKDNEQPPPPTKPIKDLPKKSAKTKKHIGESSTIKIGMTIDMSSSPKHKDAHASTHPTRPKLSPSHSAPAVLKLPAKKPQKKSASSDGSKIPVPIKKRDQRDVSPAPSIQVFPSSPAFASEEQSESTLPYHDEPEYIPIPLMPGSFETSTYHLLESLRPPSQSLEQPSEHPTRLPQDSPDLPILESATQQETASELLRSLRPPLSRESSASRSSRSGNTTPSRTPPQNSPRSTPEPGNRRGHFTRTQPTFVTNSYVHEQLRHRRTNLSEQRRDELKDYGIDWKDFQSDTKVTKKKT